MSNLIMTTPRNGSGFSSENPSRCEVVESNSTRSVTSQVICQVVGRWRLGVPVCQGRAGEIQNSILQNGYLDMLKLEVENNTQDVR